LVSLLNGTEPRIGRLLPENGSTPKFMHQVWKTSNKWCWRVNQIEGIIMASNLFIKCGNGLHF
jgi:hypothetical protein